MQTQVDIQEIIRKLIAGESIDNWTLNTNPEMIPRGTGVGADAETMASGRQIPVGALWDGKGAGYSDAYRMDGSFAHRTADETDSGMLKSYLGDALKIAAAGSGLSGFGEALTGGSFLQGAAAPFNAVFGGGEAMLGGADALTSSLGGGGSEAMSAFNLGLDPLGFGPGAGSLGMGTLGNAAASSFGLDASLIGGGLGAGGALNAASGGSSFLDKLGDFASDPMNLLKTVGTVGGLYEALNGKDEGDFTQTTTKTLDPRIDAAVFGADGKSGLLGQTQAWAAQNPTGQNQTMRDAQSGLRGLLTDPNVINGYYNMGARGQGLMNAGIAPNPWLAGRG